MTEKIFEKMGFIPDSKIPAHMAEDLTTMQALRNGDTDKIKEKGIYMLGAVLEEFCSDTAAYAQDTNPELLPDSFNTLAQTSDWRNYCNVFLEAGFEPAEIVDYMNATFSGLQEEDKVMIRAALKLT